MHLFHVLLISAITATVSATPLPDDGGPNYLPPRTLMPNYIIPVYQDKPDFAGNTQFSGEIRYDTEESNEIRTYLGWDIPANAPTYCKPRMVLSLAARNNWSASGSGKFNMFRLATDSQIDPATVSWNRKPHRSPPTAQWSIIQPISGGEAVVTGPSIRCVGGTRMYLEVAGDRASGTAAKWFELADPLNGIVLEMRNSQ